MDYPWYYYIGDVLCWGFLITIGVLVVLAVF
jgi:hypothetical protein